MLPPLVSQNARRVDKESRPFETLGSLATAKCERGREALAGDEIGTRGVDELAQTIRSEETPIGRAYVDDDSD
jgi:hypothetical protein